MQMAVPCTSCHALNAMPYPLRVRWRAVELAKQVEEGSTNAGNLLVQYAWTWAYQANRVHSGDVFSMAEVQYGVDTLMLIRRAPSAPTAAPTASRRKRRQQEPMEAVPGGAEQGADRPTQATAKQPLLHQASTRPAPPAAGNSSADPTAAGTAVAAALSARGGNPEASSDATVQP